VGSSSSQRDFAQTLIEHWNGRQWSVVTSPNPGPMYNTLYSVSAVSANDIWAVGVYANDAEVTQTLTMHWDGTSWSVVSSPSPASINNELFSVAAVSANDVWAVGFLSTMTANQTAVDQTLIEHWNGSSWNVVKSLNPGLSSDHLSGVAAISANDVWAVGDASNSSTSQTLAEHWNGSIWSVVKSSSPGSGDAFTAVATVSAHDVWAVGYTSKNSTIQTLAEHWNGTNWSVIKSANVGQHPSFWAVAAFSAHDVWAVGSNGTKTKFNQALIEHWNGTQWSVVKSPSPGSFSTQLLGTTAISASNVWAVGYADSNTLTEHYHC